MKSSCRFVGMPARTVGHPISCHLERSAAESKDLRLLLGNHAIGRTLQVSGFNVIPVFAQVGPDGFIFSIKPIFFSRRHRFNPARTVGATHKLSS
jgi:hypothetical protein